MDLKVARDKVVWAVGYVVSYSHFIKEVKTMFDVLLFLPGGVVGAVRWVAIVALAIMIVGGVVYFAKWFTFPLGGGRRKNKD